MKKPHPLRLSNDPIAMTQAIDWCVANSQHVRRTSVFQLKFGPMNFYPQTGTIYLDSGQTLNKKGFDVVKEILAAECDTLQEIITFCFKKGYLSVVNIVDLKAG